MLFSQKNVIFSILPPHWAPPLHLFPSSSHYLEKPLHHLTLTPLLISLHLFPLPPYKLFFQIYLLMSMSNDLSWSLTVQSISSTLLLKSHTNLVFRFFFFGHSPLKTQVSIDVYYIIRWYAGSRESKITKIESQTGWSSQSRRVNKPIHKQNTQILFILPFLVKRQTRFPETLS